MALTAEQLDRYGREGYLVLPSLFTAAEVAEMGEEAQRLLGFLVEASVTVGERNPRLDLQRRDGGVFVRKVQPVVDASDTFRRFSSDDRLLGPMRDILGCEPALMEEKLNYKQRLGCDVPFECGADGEGFFAHTDWAYFRSQAYPPETLSSALSIDETTSDNGPIRVLPRSHLRDFPEREGYPPVLADGAVRDDELVDVLMPAGSVVLFHSKLVHASSENRTDRPRRLMIYSHYPSTHPAEPDERNRGLRERAQAHERRFRELVAT